MGTRHRIRAAAVALAACGAGLIGAGPSSALAVSRSPRPLRTARSSSAGLPNWAIGPFTRYPGNPILAPPTDPNSTDSWEFPETFNPGVVVVNGIFHMLYRGTASGDYSNIGAATSTNGYHFQQLPSPVITDSLPSETHGVEDPRLYYLDGRYYAFFTGYNGTDIGINEAVSSDAVHWQQLGPVLADDKDAALVTDPQDRPVKIDGHYLMYYGQSSNGAFLAESTNLTSWKTIGTVHMPFPASWDPWEMCVAVTDYPTVAGAPRQSGIDLFVAGELMGAGRWYYAISQVDFSRADLLSPTHILDRPTLAPQAPYEIYGYTPHTVFTNDITFHDGRWWQYYGGGDSVVALAQAPLRAGWTYPASQRRR